MPHTFVLATNGSRGDAEPFYHLAISLKSAGHRVRVLSNHFHRPFFEKAGVEFRSTGEPVTLKQIKSFGKEMLHASPLRQVDYVVRKLLLANLEKTYNDYLQGMEGADLAVIHYIDFAAQRAAIRLSIHWASVVLCPGTIPSRKLAPMDIKTPPFFYPILWALYRNVTFLSDLYVNRSLKRVSGVDGPVKITGTFSPFANIVAASRFVADVPPDLDTSFFVSGLLKDCDPAIDASHLPIHFSDRSAGAHRKEWKDFLRFVQNQKPKVAITFGSMTGLESSFLIPLIIKTASLANVRFVVVGGWAFAGEEQNEGSFSDPFVSDERIFYIREIPYELLFSQVNIVVHHGGAGTTQEVARAGALSIVVPHIADQFYWGNLVFEKGIGSKPILPRSLSPESLASAIQGLLNDPTAKHRALEVSQKIKQEIDCSRTVEFLEGVVHKFNGSEEPNPPTPARPVSAYE